MVEISYWVYVALLLCFSILMTLGITEALSRWNKHSAAKVAAKVAAERRLVDIESKLKRNVRDNFQFEVVSIKDRILTVEERMAALEKWRG